MVHNLIAVFVLTMIIHMVETSSYALRLAGVKINKLAVALSLLGITVLISRTANLIQAPMTAKFIDYGKVALNFDVLEYLRIIIVASSFGTILGILLFPTLVNLWGRVISRFEVAGSLPKLISSVTIGQLMNTRHYVQKPYFQLSGIRYLGIPKRFILLNVLVTAIYTVGVLSSLYAAYLVPELGTSASQSSGLINGIATILLTIFIDPQIGLITDKACNNAIYKEKLGKIYLLLMISRFFGTLLAQFLLIPAAYFISFTIKIF
ncbi:lipid II flippase Amj family protein [Paenibacillus macerans]|uniref:lipid II flippase Amj family protein n=1 Tax=Paenibacillus macerans TaxID=44252 RepID=UPI0020417CFC|nr:lipid II flippase Amj family protein [Paenibacillus macerans]MCM3699422.1 lipid II flippase Amj family protein [Paenibacillus macerans]